MNRSRILLPAAFGLSVALAACGTEPLADGVPADVRCLDCHGSVESAAPPAGLHGVTSTNEVGVGAHQLHLHDGIARKAIACSECHVVPATVDAAGHADGAPAELTWGTLATANGAQPQWDHASATCASTYCHGATLAGGSRTAPKWTYLQVPDYMETLQPATCSGCHGAPPPAPHPQDQNCASCHAQTVKADGSIDLEGGMHVDGKVEVSGAGACNGCHGGADNAAPPTDLSGSGSTDDVGVGAHQAHLRDSRIRAAMACSECHVVPETAGAEGHMDGDGQAELTWGALASAEGASPAWNGESCSGVYCHGATLPGGRLTEPAWTKVDGTQASCGTCHGVPPAEPHPQGGQCIQCHPTTMSPAGGIDVAGGHHVDGTLDVGEACNACHGSAENAAPPNDTHRRQDTALATVGAHQAHLHDSPLRKAVACSECHTVPAERDAPGHLDGDGEAEVTFGTLATAQGSTPSFDGTSCSGVYCHGATLPGGRLTRPEWTKVDGTQAVCGTCHGAPPPAPHPANNRCASCHAGTMNADGSINVAGGKHMNGVIDRN